MTYHDEVREAVHKHVQTFRPRPVAKIVTADDTLDAIPPLTLKTEDGRFVKVVPSTRWLKVLEREETTYRIVEDPAQ